MAVYVVDTGFLREQRLAEFLSASASNSVAIPEYTCIESYQGDTLSNIERSTRILRRFPGQVVVLRGAMDVVEHQDGNAGSLGRDDLIDSDQTAHFREFCRGVEAAHVGDEYYCRQVLAHGEAAAKQLKVVRDRSHLNADGIRKFASELDKDHLKRIRRDDPFTQDDADWLIQQILSIAALLFESHPKVTRWPNAEELPDLFLLRYAAASCLFMMQWIRRGGIEGVAVKKLSNDVIDTSIAVFGTFFDGVLTLDNKLLHLHRELRLVLRLAFQAGV